MVEKIRNQVSLSALRGLMTRLGGMREGRKTVIVVAEGYTDYVPPQLRGNNAQTGVKGVGTSAMTGDASVDPVGAMAEDRTRFFGDMDIRMLMRDVTTDANRNNVSLYMLDPRGLAGFEFDINEGVGLTADYNSLRTTQDSLRVMADETDGRAIINRNDLGGGLAQMMRDASAYYLIGYSSAAAPTDGRFHQIRVRVKRPGIEVRARRGYWALRPDEAAAVTAGPRAGPPPDVNVALSEIAKIARAKTVRTWVGYAPGRERQDARDVLVGTGHRRTGRGGDGRRARVAGHRDGGQRERGTGVPRQGAGGGRVGRRRLPAAARRRSSSRLARRR